MLPSFLLSPLPVPPLLPLPLSILSLHPPHLFVGFWNSFVILGKEKQEVLSLLLGREK